MQRSSERLWGGTSTRPRQSGRRRRSTPASAVAAVGAYGAATLVAEVVLVAHNAELGRRGEQLAVDHLEARGMHVLARNWRCRLGEIDIIARDGGETVFIEVKTRTSHDYGHPFEAITPVKLARLRRLAIAWCEATDAAVSRIRIDAVAVLAPAEAPALIEHLEGIS